VDFFDHDAYRRGLDSVADRHAAIDVLVNNAFEFSKETGFNDPSGRVDVITKDQWMRALESGVYWHALATQVLAERMAKHGSGSIINVSSMYAIVSPDPALYEGTEVFNPPSYGAAKAALLALTRYTAASYGRPHNAPRNDEFLRRLSDRTVVGRYGEPADLKGAIVFLASDASRYVTGQCLSVDGGWTVR